MVEDTENFQKNLNLSQSFKNSSKKGISTMLFWTNVELFIIIIIIMIIISIIFIIIIIIIVIIIIIIIIINRELKQTTTTTTTKTLPNKRFNEQNNGCARAL